MAGNSDIKSLGLMVLGLLSLAILVGATFLVTGAFNDSLCNQATEGAVYDGASCEYSNGTDFATDPVSVVRTEAVTAVITTVLSFLGIVVIVGITRIILRLAKGMN